MEIGVGSWEKSWNCTVFSEPGRMSGELMS